VTSASKSKFDELAEQSKCSVKSVVQTICEFRKSWESEVEVASEIAIAPDKGGDFFVVANPKGEEAEFGVNG